MKNTMVSIIILGLLFAACGSGNYQDIKYTNKSSKDITFKTAERNSDAYSLAKDASITLSSDVPGRADIKTISESLVKWEYNKGDVYDIQFIDRKSQKLTIINFTNFDIYISEKNNLLAEQIVKAKSAETPEEYPQRTETYFFTDQPVFAIVNAPDIKFQFRQVSTNYFLGINPPGGEWWN